MMHEIRDQSMYHKFRWREDHDRCSQDARSSALRVNRVEWAFASGRSHEDALLLVWSSVR